LTGFKAGLEDDAETHPDRPDTQRWLANANAYGRLVTGLDAGEIVSDDRVRRLVREWAEAHDRAEHYERVVFEHDAIAALREQIGAGQ
jgi:gamma-glutamyl:cysteine ligase YbdK (ATP-grasp superfamily)